MVGASKILTVSYGTFSCTLEGFDDPFTAMKAIAEYFRELAADDRYFGAEPPTPDMDMLHRIAEREVQRRVEAQVSEHGVVLRAKPDEAATLNAAPDAPHSVPTAEASDETESIAAKLMRIRAVVAASRTVAETARHTPTDPVSARAPAEDESDLADDFRFGLDLDRDDAEQDGDIADSDTIQTHDPAADAGMDEPVAEAADVFAEEVADEPMDEAVEPVAEEIADAPMDEAVEAVAEEIADAPVDEAVEAVVEEIADAPMDEPVEAVAEETADAPVDEPVEAVAEESADAPVDEAVEAVAEETADEPVEAAAMSDAAKGALDLAAWRTDDPLPADIPEYDPDLDENWTPVSGARARVIKIHRDPNAAPLQMPQSTKAEEPVAQETVAQEEETDRSAIFAALVNDIDPEANEEPQNEELQADEDATLLAGIGAAIGRDGSDAEDDLARELAAIAREARRDAHEGRAILESTSGDDDASVERLMEEAKSKLEGIENRRRFSAISHLKAAVAATVADRKLASSHMSLPPEPDQADADMNRYRDDLSKAVRPHRPETEGPATTPRPKAGGTASPLVLVTEQRVDDARRPEGVVRPRRISADTFMRDDDDYDMDEDASVSPDDAKNFAEFAERLGATGLPELLEAAAAYTATVEGQPHFSRPQILRKVADVADETDFSREDGLRSFGMLLREGKIQKIDRGQFTIAGTSKFLAEGKIASR